VSTTETQPQRAHTKHTRDAKLETKRTAATDEHLRNRERRQRHVLTARNQPPTQTRLVVWRGQLIAFFRSK